MKRLKCFIDNFIGAILYLLIVVPCYIISVLAIILNMFSILFVIANGLVRGDFSEKKG